MKSLVLILSFFAVTNAFAQTSSDYELTAVRFCNMPNDMIVSKLSDGTAPRITGDAAKYSYEGAIGYHIKEKGILIEASNFMGFNVGVYGSKVLDYNPGSKILSRYAPADKPKKIRKAVLAVVKEAKIALKCSDGGDQVTEADPSVEEGKVKSPSGVQTEPKTQVEPKSKTVK